VDILVGKKMAFLAGEYDPFLMTDCMQQCWIKFNLLRCLVVCGMSLNN